MKSRSHRAFLWLVAFTAVVLRVSEVHLVSADTANREAVTQNDPGVATLSESNLLQPVPGFLAKPRVAGDNDSHGVFSRCLQEAIERKDFVAIQALYQTNGLSAKELSLELARWQTWFGEDPKPRCLGWHLFIQNYASPSSPGSARLRS